MIDGASLLLYRGYVHDIVLLSLSLFLLFITVVVFCVKFMSSSCIFDCRECVGYSLLSNLSPPDSLPVSFPLSLSLSHSLPSLLPQSLPSYIHCLLLFCTNRMCLI